ncbi:hypothetical protein OF83DRAFT_1062325, partial [Amylostereum chailletii]
MTENEHTKHFRGDLDNERSDDFLSDIRNSIRGFKLTTDSEKIEFFQDQLAGGSPAKEWFKNLDATKKNVFADVVKEFEAVFPTIEVVKRPMVDIEAEIADAKLKEEELGATVQVGGKEVMKHVAHASRLMKLAREAGIAQKTDLIGIARNHLPPCIKDNIATTFANWKMFTDAITAVDKAKVRDAAECATWYAIMEARIKQLEATTARQQSSTMPLLQGMRSLSINQRPQPSTAGVQASTQSPSTTSTTTGGRGGTAFARPMSRARDPLPHINATQLQEVLALWPQRLDTQSGKEQYMADVRAWRAKHGDRGRVTALTGFPLRPGNIGVGKGECWACASTDHR